MINAPGAPHALLKETCDTALKYLDSLPERPVCAGGKPQVLPERLPAAGIDPQDVIRELTAFAESQSVASAGPRYFGFVTGGSLPAALAADWLTSAYDQNTALAAMSPAAARLETLALDWMKDLLGLPADAAGGLTSGCTLANLTGLAAGRHALLKRQGWDVEASGLFGAPEFPVVVGAEAHASLYNALQILGLGRERVVTVAADEQGRMRADALAETLAKLERPALIAAQAGNVNSGALDPLDEIARLAERHGAWLHVDGAFGLWAAALPNGRALLKGVERAQSWATDCHKWLNVPYDCGAVFVADPEAQRAAMSVAAAYLTIGGDLRNGMDWVPEASRRARGFTVYAALRSLGRNGAAELVARCCALARRFAEKLAAEPKATILNEVVLNQAVVAFEGGTAAESDRLTRATVAALQEEGTCWAGGTVWRGRAALRLSVSNWSTTEADIDRSAAAILRCFERVRGKNA